MGGRRVGRCTIICAWVKERVNIMLLLVVMEEGSIGAGRLRKVVVSVAVVVVEGIWVGVMVENLAGLV